MFVMLSPGGGGACNKFTKDHISNTTTLIFGSTVPLVLKNLQVKTHAIGVGTLR